MRIVIATTANEGKNFEHYSTERGHEGRLMESFAVTDNGVRVIFPAGEYRIYPWSRIKFLDVFNT